MPLLRPVASLVAARPLGIRLGEPVRALGVPLFLPVGTVVRRLPDTHVGEQKALAAVRLHLQPRRLRRCQRTVAVVEIDDEEVVVRRCEGVDIGVARMEMLGVQQKEEVFHLFQLRDIVRVLVQRRILWNHIEQAVARLGDIALLRTELLYLMDSLALHIVEGKDRLARHEWLAEHRSEIFVQIAVVALRCVAVLLIAVIEAGLHQDAVKRTHETRDILLGVVLRHLQQPHGAVADEQKARMPLARIAAKLLREVDHRRLRNDVLAPSLRRRECLMHAEQACRSHEECSDSLFYLAHILPFLFYLFSISYFRGSHCTRVSSPSRGIRRRPHLYAHSVPSAGQAACGRSSDTRAPRAGSGG